MRAPCFRTHQRGPLDRGHVRFFTRNTIENLFDACNLRVIERQTVGTPFGALAGDPRNRARARITRGLTRGDKTLTRAWPRMFGYQFLYRLEVA